MKRKCNYILLISLFIFSGCVNKDKAVARRIWQLEKEASLALQTQNYSLAEKKFLAILDLKPDLEHVKNNLAILYAEYMNEPEKAIKIWEELLKEKPSNAAYHNNIAGVYWREGELDKAIETYQKSTEFHKSYHMPYYNMAQIYMQKEDWKMAEKMAETGYGFGSSDSHMNSVYIKTLLLNGKREESKAIIHQAADGTSLKRSLDLTLVRICIGDKNYSEATSLLDDILAKDPSNELYLAEKVDLLSAQDASFEEIEKIFLQMELKEQSPIVTWLKKLIQARKEYADSNLDNALALLVEMGEPKTPDLSYFEGLRLQLMATVLRDQHKLTEAEELMKKAFFLAPERVLPSDTIFEKGEAI